MINETYYGEKNRTTCLEIYTEMDGHEHVIYRQLRHQEANVTWHLALYFKEILSYRRLQENGTITVEQLPGK